MRHPGRTNAPGRLLEWFAARIDVERHGNEGTAVRTAEFDFRTRNECSAPFTSSVCLVCVPSSTCYGHRPCVSIVRASPFRIRRNLISYFAHSSDFMRPIQGGRHGAWQQLFNLLIKCVINYLLHTAHAGACGTGSRPRPDRKGPTARSPGRCPDRSTRPPPTAERSSANPARGIPSWTTGTRAGRSACTASSGSWRARSPRP